MKRIKEAVMLVPVAAFFLLLCPGVSSGRPPRMGRLERDPGLSLKRAQGLQADQRWLRHQRAIHTTSSRRPDNGARTNGAQAVKTTNSEGTDQSHADFVKKAYRDLLGREAEPDGLKFWTGRLAEEATQEQVLKGIEDTPEGETAFVKALYRELLGREAEPDGLKFWTGRLAAEATPEQVRKGIEDTQEGRTSFVGRLYRDILGRKADPDGLKFWVDRLGAGATRDEVRAVFAKSQDFRQSVSRIFREVNNTTIPPFVLEQLSQWVASTPGMTLADLRATIESTRPVPGRNGPVMSAGAGGTLRAKRSRIRQ